MEDQDLLREALVAALEAEPDIAVVACGDLRSAALVDPAGIDVAVVDYRLPDGRGTDLEVRADAKRLLVTGTNEAVGLRAALDAGFQGFATKGSGLGELAQAVRVVHGGGAVFPARLLSVVAGDLAVDHGLTGREREVLEELARAAPLAEIAASHHLSIHTVRNHVRSVLTKLGARSQLEAVVIAVRAGIVEIEP